jgi:ElaB/YqjD/DUF883 family membrane-anchored ribosome-binding protein
MINFAKAERRASKLVSHLDIDDVYDQLDNLRAKVNELSPTLGSNAGRQFDRARAYASDTAREAEEVMKDNLVASLMLAVGLGLIIGYLIRGGGESS